jgi:rhamnogalacturonyl hydrolase YesR
MSGDRSDSAVRRLRELAAMSALDTVEVARRRRPAPRVGGIDAGVRWLGLTHDVTGRRGSSKGYSLLRGWQPPFPETTGYIIGTLLEYSRRTGDESYRLRAIQMGDWEIEVQCRDGGVMEGLLTAEPKPSTVFNTGMVMHGWLDLQQSAPREEYLEAAVRAGDFLRTHQATDGAWRGEAEYHRIPHTYCARVSWALVRLAQATGDDSYRQTARRQLDWVLAMQRDNGWFESCNFEPRRDPNTHAIAYTLRGLLESAVLLGHEPYLAAVRRTSEALVDRFEALGARLPASFDSSWKPTARYECLTGLAQLGGVWLRLFEVTGQARFREAGLEAVQRAAGHQKRSSWPAIDGALAGSHPVYGRYAPLQFPNWATKFLVDSLMLRERLSA